MPRRFPHWYVVAVFHGYMFPRWVFRRVRCAIRRHHAEPFVMAKAPVRSRARGRRRVEAATKTVCSECFAPLGLSANRAWRRAAQRRG